MRTLGQQKFEPIKLMLLCIVAVATLGLCVLLPYQTPYILGAAAGLAILVYWGIKWDITVWAWFWVLSYGLLDWPGWRIEMEGFFNFSVPRFVFFAAIMVFIFRWMSHQHRFRFDRGLLWMMLAFMVFVGLSAHITGWKAATKEVASAPYYRYLGSIVFPFIMFYLLYNTNIAESEIKHALLMLTFYGWYAIFIGYMQFAWLRGSAWAEFFIWPKYILDPEYGIHFDRARGAFAGASPQAVFLTLLFFVDLYLVRKLKGIYRIALIFQLLLIPAAIFFTGVRSAYVGFLVCMLVWVMLVSRGWSRLIKLSFILLVIGVSAYATFDRLMGTDRAAGGIAQRGPIQSRIDLFNQTLVMTAKHPLTGVGFGHFVDAQQSMPKDPSTSIGHTGVLVEHNLFLNMLAETGIVGLFLTVMVFILLIHQAIKLFRKLPQKSPGFISREFVALFLVIMANYIVDAMFRDPLWDVFSNGLMWCLAGLIVCCNRMLEPVPLELPIVPHAIEAEI